MIIQLLVIWYETQATDRGEPGRYLPSSSKDEPVAKALYVEIAASVSDVYSPTYKGR